MGLIPNDQSRFVQAMKTIITKHKQLQTFKVKLQSCFFKIYDSLCKNEDRYVHCCEMVKEK